MYGEEKHSIAICGGSNPIMTRLHCRTHHSVGRVVFVLLCHEICVGNCQCVAWDGMNDCRLVLTVCDRGHG